MLRRVAAGRRRGVRARRARPRAGAARLQHDLPRSTPTTGGAWPCGSTPTRRARPRHIAAQQAWLHALATETDVRVPDPLAAPGGGVARRGRLPAVGRPAARDRGVVARGRRRRAVRRGAGARPRAHHGDAARPRRGVHPAARAQPDRCSTSRSSTTTTCSRAPCRCRDGHAEVVAESLARCRRRFDGGVRRAAPDRAPRRPARRQPEVARGSARGLRPRRRRVRGAGARPGDLDLLPARRRPGGRGGAARRGTPRCATCRTCRTSSSRRSSPPASCCSPTACSSSSTASLRAEAADYLDVTVAAAARVAGHRAVRAVPAAVTAGNRVAAARRPPRYPWPWAAPRGPRHPTPPGVPPCLPRSPSTSPGASDRCRSRRRPASCSRASAHVLVARVNGELRDLAHVLADGDVVEPVTAAEQDGLDVLRHSAAHVLAQAVQEVHPDARLGIGPPIRDGFYYDFDVETPFTPEDLKRAREGHAAHRQRGPDLRAPRDLRRRRARRAGRRALQVRADRPQGRRVRERRRGRVRRGGRRPADHLRQRAPRRHPRLGRPVPRPARADRPRCSATPSS